MYRRLFLSSALLSIAAIAGWAGLSSANQLGPCVCCADCVCESCRCDESGCACASPDGECACESACCSEGCGDCGSA